MNSRRSIAICLAIFLLSLGCGFDPETAKKRYVESGNKYFNNGKYKEASIMYRNALKKDMKYGEAYYRLGLTELRQGRPMDALTALRRAVELQPESSEAYAQLTDLYLLFYASPQNRKHIVPEMKDLLVRLEKYRRNSFEYHRLGGYVALTENDLPGALAKFSAANKVKPDQPAVVLILAQTMLAGGKPADAEQLVRDLVAKNKSYGPGYDFLYLFLRRANRVEESEKLLKDKIAALPKDIQPRLQLAVHHASMNRKDLAKSAIDEILANAKQYPSAYSDVANLYITLREPDTAMAVLREGAKARPEQEASYQKRIIEIMATQRRIPDALQLIEELIRKDPKDSEAVAIRASLWLSSGDPQRLQAAIADLQSVVSKMPENHVLRFNLGGALMNKGDVAAAQVQFEESIKIRPDYLPSRIALGQSYLVQRAFPKALVAADGALKIAPNNIAARLVRIAALMGTGEAKTAKAEVAEILKADPNQRDANFQLATINFAEKNYKEAEAGFRKLYEFVPPDSRGLMGLTEVYMSQNRPDAAIQIMQKELAANPNRIDYLIALANVAVRAEKYDIAIDAYKKFLEKQPRASGVFLRLGEAYRRKGDNEQAMAHFQKAREYEPRNPTAYLQMALLLESLGRRQEAVPLYNDILNLQPDNGVALNNLAYALAEAGKDLDRAQNLAERARQSMPDSPDVADTLGWIYIRKNLSDNAVQVFNNLSGKYPKNPVYQLRLGMAYMQKGDKDKAKQAFQSALRNNPTKEDQARIREMMGKLG